MWFVGKQRELAPPAYNPRPNVAVSTQTHNNYIHGRVQAYSTTPAPYLIFDVDGTPLVEAAAIHKPIENPDPVFSMELTCDTAEFILVSAEWNCTDLDACRSISTTPTTFDTLHLLPKNDQLVVINCPTDTHIACACVPASYAGSKSKRWDIIQECYLETVHLSTMAPLSLFLLPFCLISSYIPFFFFFLNKHLL